MSEVTEMARTLARGAVAAKAAQPLKVQLVKVSKRKYGNGAMERMRMTLANHNPVGAFGHVLQKNLYRWIYTTTLGHAESATLKRWANNRVEVISAGTEAELIEALERSLTQAMENATSDGRSRRVTLRGVDPIARPQTAGDLSEAGIAW